VNLLNIIYVIYKGYVEAIIIVSVFSFKIVIRVCICGE
jgi:hypothetical protein